MRPFCDSCVLESTRATRDAYSDTDSNNYACRGSDPATATDLLCCTVSQSSPSLSLCISYPAPHPSLELLYISQDATQLIPCCRYFPDAEYMSCHRCSLQSRHPHHSMVVLQYCSMAWMPPRHALSSSQAGNHGPMSRLKSGRSLSTSITVGQGWVTFDHPKHLK